MPGSTTSNLASALSALRARLDDAVAHGRTAGVQYLLMRGGEVLLEHCAGHRDVAAKLPVEPSTTFNLYSITKPFTAALVLELARQHHFELDAPIARATDLGGLARLGSVAQTLVHRAGFANPMPLRWFHLAQEDPGFDEAAFVHRVLDAQRGRKPSSPRYSNPGYLALGVAVERALGRPYRHALTDVLLSPLQLASDQRLAFTPAAPEAHARGHLRRHGLLDMALGGFVDRNRIVAGTAGRWVHMHRHHVDGSAYGGLIGNASGLARFGQAVLGLGDGIDPAVRSELLRRVPGPGVARSVGWFCGELAGQAWFAHAGGGLGAYGELRLYPQLSVVSAVLTNRPGLRDERLLDRLDVLWLRAAPAL
jgi:D-alanyl-D-alanine carboxypeptidase